MGGIQVESGGTASPNCSNFIKLVRTSPDGQGVMFSSSDLKEPDLKKKYEYGFWTNNEAIVKRVIEYFETLWSNSGIVDLYRELKD